MQNKIKLKLFRKNILSGFDHLSTPIGLGLTVGIGIVLGLIVIWFSSPMKILAVAVGLLFILFTIIKIEWGLLFLVFTTYTHFSTVVIEYHGAPSIAKLFVVLLLLCIFIRWIIYGEQPTGWVPLTVLISVYGLIGFASILYSADTALTINALYFFSKNCIIAIIVVILLNRKSLFRNVIWSLLIAGIFMGTIGVYQHLTGTFENVYWGFGRAVLKNIVDETSGYRISGPIGGPNFFAQILLVLIPLALDRLIGEKSLLLKFFAVWALAVCMLSIIFTYSRGAFVGIFVMLVVYLILHPSRPKAAVLLIVLLIPMLYFVPSQYIERIKTLEEILPGNEKKALAEASYRGRKSELMAAYQMFVDHPFRGVGLGNYEYHYQQYARILFLDFRRENREAHSRYLEVLAETGLLGFFAFIMILWQMMYGLWKTRKKTIKLKIFELEGSITALGVGMIGFLTASIFLHDAYTRFFWLLVGISFALPNIVNHEAKSIIDNSVEINKESKTDL